MAFLSDTTGKGILCKQESTNFCTQKEWHGQFSPPTRVNNVSDYKHKTRNPPGDTRKQTDLWATRERGQREAKAASIRGDGG